MYASAGQESQSGVFGRREGLDKERIITLISSPEGEELRKALLRAGQILKAIDAGGHTSEDAKLLDGEKVLINGILQQNNFLLPRDMDAFITEMVKQLPLH